MTARRCLTPDAVYRTSMPTAASLLVKVTFPFVIEAWASGRSAVKDGPKQQRYKQAMGERLRIDDLIHDQMEVVAADAYRVMGFALAAAEWNAEVAGRPFGPEDWHSLTMEEQMDFLLRSRP